MRAIPFEIDESARVDGCTNMRLYWSIIMPIAKPAISTLVILDFYLLGMNFYSVVF